MKIKQILSQSRRDFTATMVCEHCGAEEHNKYGYDDANYHNNVVPVMVCKSCGQTAPAAYEPRAPKYASTQIV